MIQEHEHPTRAGGEHVGITVDIKRVEPDDYSTPILITITCVHGKWQTPYARKCMDGCAGSDRAMMKCRFINPSDEMLEMSAVASWSKKRPCLCQEAYWTTNGPHHGVARFRGGPLRNTYHCVPEQPTRVGGWGVADLLKLEEHRVLSV